MGDCLKRAEQAQPAWREWWENTEAGLEQGFDVPRPPARASSDELLRIRLHIDGARAEVDADAKSATLKVAGGHDMAYEALAARDADGHALTARFLPSAGGLTIEVDDRAARYPIVVDPLLTTIKWKAAEINQAGARLGISVASAGDVDRDGYGDVLVGADMYDNGSSADEGRAYLYRGSATGLLAAPSWNAGSGHAGSRYGISVAGAGDVNGDGYGDVIIGAALDSSGQANEGRAYVYYGGSTASFLSAGPILEVNLANSAFGFSVACAGDINGDGYGDVIVGAYAFTHGFSQEGRAFVYLGSATGVPATAIWTGDGGQANALYGAAVAGLGDVNGDGYGDIIVGAYGYDGSNGTKVDSGKAFLYYGHASGPTPGTADWTMESTVASSYLGLSVASAGDPNGDGYADIVVGSPGFDQGTTLDVGKANVFFGGPSNPAITAGWTVTGTATNEYVGWSVASAGDVNGDGYDDVAIGASGYSHGETTEGMARVYHGGADGISNVPGISVTDNSAGYYGMDVAGVGDVNGDGYDDVLVGAPLYGSTAQGRAFAYYGGASGLSSSAAWTRTGAIAKAYLGQTVAAAGDVNSDGFADVLVSNFTSSTQASIGLYLGGSSGLASAPAWTSSTTGATGILAHGVGDLNGDGYGDVVSWGSWAGGGEGVFYGSGGASPLQATPNRVVPGHDGGRAGDVNGDGYDDLIVGDPVLQYVYLYHGGPTGIAAGYTTRISGAGLQDFGMTIGGAGDVNGDGYADVFATTYSSASRCYVMLGGSGGVSPSLAWNVPAASCAGAGDVNGDGYGDLVTGDGQDHASGSPPPTTAFGWVSVYTGSSSGLSASPTSGATSFVGGDGLGFAVESAGDVNGDGYSDIIAGAPFLTGRAAVFYGNGLQSSSGVALRAGALRVSPRAVIPPGGRAGSSTQFLAGFGAARGPQGRTVLRIQTEDKAFGTAFNGAAATYSTYLDSTRTGVSIQTYVTPSGSGIAPHWRARMAYRPGSNLPWFQRSRWVYGGRLGEPRSIHVRIVP